MATGLKSPFELFLEDMRNTPASTLTQETAQERQSRFNVLVATEAAKAEHRDYGIKVTSWVIFAIVMLLGAKYFPDQTGLFLVLLALSLILIHASEVMTWVNMFKL